MTPDAWKLYSDCYRDLFGRTPTLSLLDQTVSIATLQEMVDRLLAPPEDVALTVLREIIGECETKPGPIWKHIAVPDELYERAKALCKPQGQA